MTKRIFDSYPSEEEALAAVTDLQTKGYKAEDLVLLSNKRTQAALEDRTDVEVKSSSDGKGGDSFLDKIRRVFTQEEETEENPDTKKRLVEAGLSEEQAIRYAAEVDDGHILIAADEESSGSAIKPLSDPNLDPVAVPDSTDTVTGVGEPTEDITRTTAGDPEPSVESTHPSERNRVDSPPEDKK